MQRGIALGGTIALADEWAQRIPCFVRQLAGIFAYAAAFRRDVFVKELRAAIRDQLPDCTAKKVIGKGLEGACAFGSVDVLTNVLEKYGECVATAHLEAGLEQAAESGNLSVVKLLTGHINGAGLTGARLDKAIIAATRGNHVDLLRYLVVDCTTMHGEGDVDAMIAALAVAAHNGSIEAMKVLLGENSDGDVLVADPNVNDNLQQMVLEAVVSGHVHVLQYLWARRMGIEGDADPRLEPLDFSFDDNAALQKACDVGRVEILRFLLQKDARGDFMFPGIDPGAACQEPLLLACRQGWIEIVKELLQTDENAVLVYPTVIPDVSHNRPLRLAAKYNQLEVLQFLMQGRRQANGTFSYQYRVDPAAKDQSARKGAAKRGHVKVVRWLLQRDANGNAVYPDVLIPAFLSSALVSVGTREVMEALVQQSQQQFPHRVIQSALALKYASLCGDHEKANLLRRALEE